MYENDQDEVIVDDVEETNEEEDTDTQAQSTKVEKPKRTPQEEYEYFVGRAERLAKKYGFHKEEKPAEKDNSTPPTPSDDLDYGEKAYLRSALNMKGADELQLAREWKKKYGSTVEEMETDEVFNARLQNLRDARESANAIPKGKNRSGQTGNTDIDIAVARFKETGTMPDDLKTRIAIKNKMLEEEKSGQMFSGPSVVSSRR